MKWIEDLPKDFQQVSREGAKVCLVKDSRFGVITSLNEETVTFNVGSKREPLEYRLSVFEYIEGLQKNRIIPKVRTKVTESGIKIEPRSSEYAAESVSPPEPTPTMDKAQEPVRRETEASEGTLCNFEDLQEGYLHVRSGKFSKEPKSGYSKIYYRFEKKEVTVKVTPEQLKELKKMGLV